MSRINKMSRIISRAKICWVIAVAAISLTNCSDMQAQILTAKTAKAGLKSYGTAEFLGERQKKSDSRVFRINQNTAAIRPLPLLRSFGFEYQTSDHHLRQMRLFASSSGSREIQANSSFADKNGDDRYNWQASYLLVDPAEVFVDTVEGTFRGSATRRLRPPNPGDVFVLIGFQLEFTGGDHHVDHIGIREVRGDLSIDFADKNGDDQAKYVVRYAYLPARFVSRSRKITNSRTFFKNTVSSAATGQSVISGFEFDFASRDHHIKSIGAEIIGNNVRATYHDRGKRDIFSYCIEIANLNLR